MNKVLIINGPNLNLLGSREKNIYGENSINELQDLCRNEANSLNIILDFAQTNYEGKIIDLIQEANIKQYRGIIINPGAYSHTSIAIMDAIRDSQIPVIEVHISNIYRREVFRQNSVTAKSCDGVITGLGFNSYLVALYAIAKL